MLKQSLRNLNRKLQIVMGCRSNLEINEELITLYQIFQSLHHNVKQYLRHNYTSQQLTSVRDPNLKKFPKSALLSTHENIPQEEGAIEVSSIKLGPLSLMGTSTIKANEKLKLKLAKPLSLDKNFISLIENMKLVVPYGEKLKAMMKRVVVVKQMDCSYCQEDTEIQGALDSENKENETTPLNLTKLIEQFEKIILDCSNILEVQQNLQSSSSHDKKSYQSQSSGTDKKSLLTQMLLETEILESEYDSPKTSKFHTKHTSQYGQKGENGRLLVQEFDFLNYKIQGKIRRKETKIDTRNSGQCAQCTIF